MCNAFVYDTSKNRKKLELFFTTIEIILSEKLYRKMYEEVVLETREDSQKRLYPVCLYYA